MSDQAGYVLTPKVSHVIDRKLGIDYGFMYHISTSEELESYWNFSAIPRGCLLRQGVRSYKFYDWR